MEDKYRDQAAMLANRVKKRYGHLRKRYKKENLEMFRLYDWDIPEIRAVVDWYAGHLVIGEYSRKQSTPDWLPAMGKAVAEALNVPGENLHLKIRRAGIKEGTRYRRLANKNIKIPMWERDLQFLINPSDYVDTGLFSDHRNTRQRVRQMAKGKDFLNLYCYTGAFTCYAAKGGAASTLSVDRSETAITWVKENLELNGLYGPNHTLVQQDTLDFLKRIQKKGLTFDLAVVDPPSYSTTRITEQHFDIARDHPILLNTVFHLMRPGATLFFSTNHQNFDLKTDQLSAADITEITDQTIPEDYENKRKKNPQMLGGKILMFDPYEYRTSRDIRNQLCNDFLETLHDGDRQRFDTRSAALKQKAPDPAHRHFVDDRIRRYNALFKTLGISEDSDAPVQADGMHIAALLFSADLFYECHEWLEEFWLQAAGPEKKALQALIRTAGAFTLHEAGRINPARSSAEKARALLHTFRDHIPPPFDRDQLLQSLDSIPAPE